MLDALISLQLLHDVAAGWRIGENASYEHVRAPQRVTDHFTASEVFDLETQVAVSLVCLEQRVVGVGAEELHMDGREKKIQSVNAAPLIRDENLFIRK